MKRISNAIAVTLLLVLSASLFTANALAGEGDLALSIKDHRFEPAQLEVPAGKKFRLVIKNLDSTPEEFESHDLKREKIIAGNGQAVITIGPLKPGTYEFVGEYHERTARGRIIAK